MELLTHLWLPILASAAAVWIYSAASWMFLQIHKNDFKKLPDDTKVMDFVRSLNIQPGVYGYPNMHCDGENKERMKEIWKTGPMGMLTLWRMPNMGVNMFLTFLVCLVANFLIAYLVSEAGVGHGAPFAKLLQTAGTAGILAYTVSAIPGAIWFQHNKASILSGLFDGIVMGLITGAVMGWLWPK